MRKRLFYETLLELYLLKDFKNDWRWKLMGIDIQQWAFHCGMVLH